MHTRSIYENHLRTMSEPRLVKELDRWTADHEQYQAGSREPEHVQGEKWYQVVVRAHIYTYNMEHDR